MPDIDVIMQKVLDAVPFRLAPEDGAEAARAVFRNLPRRPLHPEVRAEDRLIEGAGGQIPIRIYWPPEHAAPAPLVMFFHGGAFAVGDLDSYDGTARQHVVGADAVVIAVHYRLAPEHPYPAAVEDVWAATQWAAEHAAELGVDPARIAVAGDSAGGTLSAVVTQLARDNAATGAPSIAFQLLWYPGTMWDISLPSYAENAEAPILDLTAMAVFTEWYVGDVDMSDPPAGLAPGRATNFAGLPPAYIAVAGHDPLRDDGLKYAESLSAAEVPVELHNAETLTHGYLGYAGVVPTATEAMNRGLAALRAALHS